MQDHGLPQCDDLFLQCDDLFLLIGANTLPNWVAAKLLLKQGGRAHLIYTKGVVNQARRLKKVLEDEEQTPVSWFETAEADERDIYDKVKAYAQQLKQNDKRKVGLNYTGGTKIMAVHAHRAIHAAGISDCVMSYLNAGDLEMKFDSPPGGSRDVSLLPPIRLNLKKLFNLHEDPKKFKYETVIKCPEAARGLAIIHSKEAGQKIWQGWFKQFKDSKFSDQTLLPTENDFSRDVEIHLNQQTGKSYSNQAMKDILEKVMSGYQQVLAGFRAHGGDTLQTVVQRNNADDFRDLTELSNWLNGLWLEHYTLSQLAACRAEAGWNNDGLATNLSATSEEGRSFQSDVLAVRGYQLYYLSCYTGSDFTTTKLKLFEAMVRVAQVGGEYARAAVVACVDDHAYVRRQMEADWEREKRRGQFEVFGREHLPDLADRIQKWVNSK